MTNIDVVLKQSASTTTFSDMDGQRSFRPLGRVRLSHRFAKVGLEEGGLLLYKRRRQHEISERFTALQCVDYP
nr:hypothetical protein Itr_chr02CG13200 [Ipomoea trifida]